MCTTNIRWQLGGNIDALRLICEYNWKECPGAVLKYVWSEIVTDVVECLNDDSILWRILGLVLLCMLILHTIHYKTRCAVESAVNRENVNKVAFKVQDLELKVNILTYKLQYGTWPLPQQIESANFKSYPQNVKLTLSESPDRNSWVKHLLFSPRRSKASVPKPVPKKSRKLQENSEKTPDVETKYMSAKFGTDVSPIGSIDAKSLNASSEKFVGHSKRSSRCFENFAPKNHKLSKSENLALCHRPYKKSTVNSKIRKKQLPECLSETYAQKRRSKFTENPETDEPFEKFVKVSNECNKFMEENKNWGFPNSSSENTDFFMKTGDGKNTSLGESAKNSLEMLIPKNQDKLREPMEESKFYESRENDLNVPNGVFQNRQLENSVKNRKPKFLPPSLSITFLTEPKTRIAAKSQENLLGRSSKSFLVPKQGKKSPDAVRETLDKVEEKLESLHKVLRLYEVEDFSMPLRELIAKEEGIMLRSLSKLRLQVQNRNEKNRSVTFNVREKSSIRQTSSSEYEQCDSDPMNPSSSTSISIKSYSRSFNIFEKNYPRPRMTLNSVKKFPSNQTIYLQRRIIGPERGQASDECTSDSTSRPIDSVDEDKLSCLGAEVGRNRSYVIRDNRISNSENDLKSEPSNPMDTEEAESCSGKSSRSDLSSSDLENKSTEVLLQEALEFKKALLSQMELEKQQQKIKEDISETSESSDTSSRVKMSSYYQSKSLDIITEEQSTSSSTDKTPKMIQRQSKDSVRDSTTKIASVPKIMPVLVEDEVEKKPSEILDTLDSTNSLKFFSTENIWNQSERKGNFQNSSKPEDENANIQPGDVVQGQTGTSVSTPVSGETPEKNSLGNVDEATSTSNLIELETGTSSFGKTSCADFGLKRRPGTFSLGREGKVANICRDVSESRSFFESAESEVDIDEKPIEFSVMHKSLALGASDDIHAGNPFKELLRSPNLESCSSQFRETDFLESGDNRSDDKDSPLTSRTVIRVGEDPLEPQSVELMDFTDSLESLDPTNEKKNDRQVERAAENEDKSLILMDLETDRSGYVDSRDSSGNLHFLSTLDFNSTTSSYADASSYDFTTGSGSTLNLDKSATSPQLPGERPGKSLQCFATPSQKRGTQSSSVGTLKLKSLEKAGGNADEKSDTPEKNEKTIPTRRRSKSNLTPRNKSESFDSSKMFDNLGIKEKERETKLRARSSSRSSIPVLTSRLETSKKENNRSVSPMRGPLTMTRPRFESQEFVETEGKPAESVEGPRGSGNNANNNNNNSKKNKNSGEGEPIPKVKNAEKLQVANERTVIYVNIMTEHDRATTRIVDPKKFLEYARDRELRIQNVVNTQEGKPKKERDHRVGKPKILTIVSSVIDEDDDFSSNSSSGKILSSPSVSKIWPPKSDKREIEISAKPSVRDTSTSVSDIPDASSAEDQFHIFEIPKELTKEEYILLLDTLNQDPHLAQLKKMRALCKKLGLGFQ